jgi:LmbE family N-acetylglucosaminyl deacetylase
VLHDSEVQRVLVVTAHPDDVDFGAGGTVAGWVDAGIEVSYCICTDGQAGGADPDVPREQIPHIRRAEQTAAGVALGVRDIRFLGHIDGRLEPTYDLRKEIVRVIRQVRPDRMLIQSPERNWDRIAASHPDHLAAGEAAMQAVYPDARNPFAMTDLLDEEGLEPWTVREVWLMATPHPTHHVDVTETFERKVAALRAHESQTGHMEDLEGFIRGWAERVALDAGLAEGRLAEAFRVVATG